MESDFIKLYIVYFISCLCTTCDLTNFYIFYFDLLINIWHWRILRRLFTSSNIYNQRKTISTWSICSSKNFVQFWPFCYHLKFIIYIRWECIWKSEPFNKFFCIWISLFWCCKLYIKWFIKWSYIFYFNFYLRIYCICSSS